MSSFPKFAAPRPDRTRRGRRAIAGALPFEPLESRLLHAFTAIPAYLLPENRPAASAAVGTGATTTAAATPTSLTGAFDIQVVAGSGLSGNAAALAAFNRAAAQWEARITDPIVVRIDADLSNLNNASVIGETSSTQVQDAYATVRNQMVADAANESDDGIVASLPTSMSFLLPSGYGYTGRVGAAKAAMKALGFAGLDAQFGASDATMTFNSGFAFDYDSRNGVAAGTMDFESVAVHEIGHALGFTSMADTVDFYAGLGLGFGLDVPATTLDLFRFENATAGRDPATAAEFASFARSLRPNVDAITDGITPWNAAAAENRMSTGAYTGDGRQASHWKDGELTGTVLGTLDPTLAYGQTWRITDADWRALDLIGWDIAPMTVAPPPPPPNAVPHAVNDVATIAKTALLTGAAPGVLANDTDANGDALTVTSIANATTSKGARVTINANGSYTYDPRGSATLQALAVGARLDDVITYQVRDGRGGTDTATLTVTVTGGTPGDGLRVQYFSDANQTRSYGFETLDPDGIVNQNWGTGSPAAGVPVDNFSARWRGRVVAPTTGDYTFYVKADDNVRLFVDGQLVVRYWSLPSTHEWKSAAPLRFAAGSSHNIQLDYREFRGKASVTLSWLATNAGATVLPKGLIPRTQYYSTPTPAVVRDPYLIDASAANDNAIVGRDNGTGTTPLAPTTTTTRDKRHGRSAVAELGI